MIKNNKYSFRIIGYFPFQLRETTSYPPDLSASTLIAGGAVLLMQSADR